MLLFIEKVHKLISSGRINKTKKRKSEGLSAYVMNTAALSGSIFRDKLFLTVSARSQFGEADRINDTGSVLGMLTKTTYKALKHPKYH